MKRGVGGVSGVLDDLLGQPEPKEQGHAAAGPNEPKRDEPPAEGQHEHTAPAEAFAPTDPPDVSVQRQSHPPIERKAKARLGRPPGKRQVEPKEKATLWLSAQVMADYRDWSWEERCNVGELVERALVEHRKRYRRARDRGQTDKGTE